MFYKKYLMEKFKEENIKLREQNNYLEKYNFVLERENIILKKSEKELETKLNTLIKEFEILNKEK